MESNPLLSVIIPVYNVKEYLSDCIDSITVNHDNSLEIILVDDGSTDGSSEICDSYIELDSRIKVIHQKNSGVGAARNNGIKQAKGKWVCFIDSDDWINAEALKRVLLICEQKTADIVAFSYEMERTNGKLAISSDSGNLFSYNMVEKKEIFQQLCLQNQMYWPNVVEESKEYPVMTIAVNKIFRKDFLINEGLCFKENIAQHEDRIFNYECIEHADNILFYDIIVYHYRYRSTSAVHSDGVKMCTQMRETIYCFYDVIGRDNLSILNGAFAYSCIQILWTLVDRLGKRCSAIVELPSRSRQLTELMKDPIIKKAIQKVRLAKIESLKHKVVCFFIKIKLPLIPIAFCFFINKVF